MASNDRRHSPAAPTQSVSSQPSRASKLCGDWIDPVRGRITYRVWSERYFAHALHKRPTTLARDHSVNEKHLLPAIGERQLASLTPLDIPRVVHQMSDTLSPGTVRTGYAVLRAILNAAVEAEILAVSPCRGVRLPASGGTCRDSSPSTSSSAWPTRRRPSTDP
jgi:hypothetical protein